jgi:hypothetical protein
MNNPICWCTRCRTAHNNPIVTLFNEFIKRAYPDQKLTEEEEMTFYRVYTAGQHDALALLIRISDHPEELASDLLTGLAEAVRDALVMGIPDDPVLRAQVHKAVSERFYIKEDHCFGN